MQSDSRQQLAPTTGTNIGATATIGYANLIRYDGIGYGGIGYGTIAQLSSRLARASCANACKQPGNAPAASIYCKDSPKNYRRITEELRHMEPQEATTLTAAIQRRQLVTPLLLLLAGHRPLAFVGGQLCYALAPLCALLGWQGCGHWAALLSAPDAYPRIAQLLTTPSTTKISSRKQL